MKNAILILFFMTQACTNSESSEGRQAVAEKPDRVVACQPSNDPMACLRDNCEAIGALFNTTQNRCECPIGEGLVTAGGFRCEQIKITENLSGSGVGGILSGKTAKRNYRLFLDGLNSSIVQKFFLSAGGFLGLMPLWTHAHQSIEIYQSAEAMRDLNVTPQSIRTFSSLAQQLINFVKQPALNLEVNANGAIRDAMLGVHFNRIVTLPSGSPIETGRSDLNEIAQQSLAMAQQSVLSERILSYTEDGCIDQCTGRTELITSSHYVSYRTRYFYSGVLVQDQISIFDLENQNTALVMYLLGGKVANFILNDGLTATLHGNEGNVADSLIGTIEEYPNSKNIQPFALDEQETPVVIFETSQNPSIETAVLRGPFTKSHVYGWFRPEDQLPYFKNYQDLATQFGEEEIEMGPLEGHHGYVVSFLASSDFTHPIIPFAGSDILAGNFEKFLNNYSGKNFVANMSEIFALSPLACKKSGMGRSIQKTADRALWVLGAGNSGLEFDLTSRACPQTIVADNVIRVAATSSGEGSLSPISAFGERTVEIAEVGCASEVGCNDQKVGTSYAAPRLASKLVSLMDRYPGVSPKAIRFALLATARVPHLLNQLQPLPVISGGTADADAASRLLDLYASWPVDHNLTSAGWQKLLNDARKNQIAGSFVRRSITMSAAELFMSRGGLQ